MIRPRDTVASPPCKMYPFPLRGGCNSPYTQFRSMLCRSPDPGPKADISPFWSVSRAVPAKSYVCGSGPRLDFFYQRSSLPNLKQHAIAGNP